MEIIGFTYSRIHRQKHCQWILERMESSSGGGEANGLRLQRVQSASLDPAKSWFALNFALCGGKPSRFCLLGYAQVFPDEFDDFLETMEFPRPRVGSLSPIDAQKRCMLPQPLALSLEFYAKSRWTNFHLLI